MNKPKHSESALYLCFESDGKRSAFPESSIISVDENGFTLHGPHNARAGSSTIFFRMDAFQGASPTFQQALVWIRRMPAQTN